MWLPIRRFENLRICEYLYRSEPSLASGSFAGKSHLPVRAAAGGPFLLVDLDVNEATFGGDRVRFQRVVGGAAHPCSARNVELASVARAGEGGPRQVTFR